MSGTKWVSIGKGATVREINARMDAEHPPGVPEGPVLGRLVLAADKHLLDLANSYRTNLRLTGEPLTAEDVERISHAQ